jgi:hypothetical protein
MAGTFDRVAGLDHRADQSRRVRISIRSQERQPHATAIMIVTPEGKLAQYYGVEYPPKTRLGLIQASQNKIGTLADQVLLYCYHYDPTTGKYGAIISQ